MNSVYIAIDLGGGSGRVMAAAIADGRMQLECIHRFPNRQVRLRNHIHWDVPALFAEIIAGLTKAVERGMTIRSIGIDTWGVDFGLTDRAGNIIGNPISYRDEFSAGMPGIVLDKFGPQPHYELTGTQVMHINTLFQLLALRKEDPDMLSIASRLLFMPDLFSYLLCGSVNTEPSIASTSEMLDAASCTWAREMLDDLGLPSEIMPDIVPSGTVRGMLSGPVAAEIGISYPVPVVAVGSHDTASAVYAIPPAAPGEVRAFLSSGTWSLLGVELDRPLLTEDARLGGFTNERGADGRITLLQNITGLWIVQTLVAAWRRKGIDADIPALVEAARHAAIDSVIDVDDPAFHNPRDMESAIRQYCSERALAVPATPAETMLCVLRSLAVRYSRGITQLDSILPSPVTSLTIIGGGARNTLLNELTARECGIPVNVGPYEATAVGNIIRQAVALGDIDSPSEISQICEK